jgi:hypothetical protein
MRVLIVGWDREWTRRLTYFLEKELRDIKVESIHHNSIEAHPAHNVLLTQILDFVLVGSFCYDCFIVSTDSGFRPAWECVHMIRLQPQYRHTPIFISSNGAARDLEEVMALNDPCMVQWSA